MAAVFDANMTGGNGAGGLDQNAAAATSVTTSSAMIVGALATLLIVTLAWGSSTSVDPSSRTCTWDGVAMIEGPTGVVTSGGRSERASIFYLVNPAPGTKTLTAAWAGACDVYMSATSFSGTDAVTGIKVADSVTATATTTITITSDATGLTVAVFCVDGAAPTTNFNAIYSEAPLTPGGGASYQLGGASNAHTFIGAGGTIQILAGVHVIAAATGPSNSPPSFRPRLFFMEDEEGPWPELDVRNWWGVS